VTLTSTAVVAATALVAPLVALRIRMPSIVVEIALGAAIGPHGLGWATPDAPVAVLALIGLAFLLLLSGLDIDVARIRGPLLQRTLTAFGVSVATGLGIGLALKGAGLVRSPLLVATILSATSVGIVAAIMDDAGVAQTRVGQSILGAASVAEILPIIALSLLFSEKAGSVGAKAALLVAFLLLVAVSVLALLGLERLPYLSRMMLELQDTVGEIRVRGAMTLMLLFAAIASRFGLEAILGCFLAGAALRVIDRDEALTHQHFHDKLRAVGYGAFVPFFFVSTGMGLGLHELTNSPSTMARVPVFLAALLLVRAAPTTLLRSIGETRRQSAAAGLMQATSLSLPIVAGRIGLDLGLIEPRSYVALVVAGLISVVAFPPLALRLLHLDA
jgi:Kef-type K+ transport system membrane component KefB